MPKRSEGLVNVPFCWILQHESSPTACWEYHIYCGWAMFKMGHFTTPVMSVWAEGPRKQDVQKFRVSGS